MNVDLQDNLNTSICELAALHALDALDGEDLVRFEQHLLNGCEACEQELAQVEKIVDLLAYAPTPISPSVEVRSRLFQEINQPPKRRHPHREHHEPEFMAIRTAEIQWQPFLIPGSKARMIYIDQAAREILYLVRADGGVRHPAHRHARIEEIFMLEGHLKIGDEIYGPGDYIRSAAGSVHEPSETCDECMFLLRASLDDEIFTEPYVEREDRVNQ